MGARSPSLIIFIPMDSGVHFGGCPGKHHHHHPWPKCQREECKDSDRNIWGVISCEKIWGKDFVKNWSNFSVESFSQIFEPKSFPLIFLQLTVSPNFCRSLYRRLYITERWKFHWMFLIQGMCGSEEVHNVDHQYVIRHVCNERYTIPLCMRESVCLCEFTLLDPHHIPPTPQPLMMASLFNRSLDCTTRMSGLSQNGIAFRARALVLRRAC